MYIHVLGSAAGGGFGRSVEASRHNASLRREGQISKSHRWLNDADRIVGLPSLDGVALRKRIDAAQCDFRLVPDMNEAHSTPVVMVMAEDCPWNVTYRSTKS